MLRQRFKNAGGKLGGSLPWIIANWEEQESHLISTQTGKSQIDPGKRQVSTFEPAGTETDKITTAFTNR